MWVEDKALGYVVNVTLEQYGQTHAAGIIIRIMELLILVLPIC